MALALTNINRTNKNLFRNTIERAVMINNNSANHYTQCNINRRLSFKKLHHYSRVTCFILISLHLTDATINFIAQLIFVQLKICPHFRFGKA